jgi:dihydrofolate reductase
MSAVKVLAFTLSIDGFGAGAEQSLAHPLGVGAQGLHAWMLHTRSFRAMFGLEGGDEDDDDRMVRQSMAGMGAWILGRNMFGPVRGPWPDHSWRGWWGEEPPYHVPVFVLTQHARPPLEMQGGTVFHFVTGGIHDALARAREAAGPRDVRIGGGVSTVRQYLQAGLVDEMHLALSPMLLGRGESLLAGIDLLRLGLRCTAHLNTPQAMHLTLKREAEPR